MHEHTRVGAAVKGDTKGLEALLTGGILNKNKTKKKKW